MKKHFRSFGVRPLSFSKVMTAFSWLMCSSMLLENSIMSSRHTIMGFHGKKMITISIARWNMLGVIVSPNDLRVNLKRPWCDNNVALW